jgi:1,4-alpha-glucan branching enzyme
VEEKAYSSAAQATSAAAEASSEVEADDGAAIKAKAPLVEEKPRVISPPGDGQRIYEIDPMLEGFRGHLDYR